MTAKFNNALRLQIWFDDEGNFIVIKKYSHVIGRLARFKVCSRLLRNFNDRIRINKKNKHRHKIFFIFSGNFFSARKMLLTSVNPVAF